MAIVLFVKEKHDPEFKVNKFSQAVWVDKKGNTTFDLETIIDLEDVKKDNKLHKLALFTSGIIKNGVEDRINLLRDIDFCSYLYNGDYCKLDPDHVEMTVEPGVSKYVKIPEIKEIDVNTNRSGFSKVTIFFNQGLFCESEQDSEHGKEVKFAAFRIRYKIPKFCRKIRKKFFMETTWTIDIRYQDFKIFGEAGIQGNILYSKFAYFWIVLPEGRFVTEFAPTEGCYIRVLEMEPWKKVCPDLKGNSICYGWKFERGTAEENFKNKQRIHMEYRLPALDPTIAFLAFVLASFVFIIDFLRDIGAIKLIKPIIGYIKDFFNLIGSLFT